MNKRVSERSGFQAKWNKTPKQWRSERGLRFGARGKSRPVALQTLMISRMY